MNKVKDLDYKVKTYLIDCIESDGYDAKPETMREKIDFVDATFKSEYGQMIARLGPQNAMREWLSGLPSSINTFYTYHDIIKQAQEWGVLDANYKESDGLSICQNYFNFLAAKLLQLINKSATPKKLRLEMDKEEAQL